MIADAILDKMRKHSEAAGREAIGAIGAVASVKAEEKDGATEIVAIATTDDTDLDDEIVRPDGLERSYINKNRQVFLDHEYSMSSVAGVIRSIGAFPDTTNQTGWRVRIRLNSSEAGKSVERIAREHGQIGLSIGFFPTDYGPLTEEEREKYARGGRTPTSIVRAARWFELSFTALPCNVSCQGSVSEVEGGTRVLSAVRGLSERGEITRSAASMLGAGEDRKKMRLNIATGNLEPIN